MASPFAFDESEGPSLRRIPPNRGPWLVILLSAALTGAVVFAGYMAFGPNAPRGPASPARLVLGPPATESAVPKKPAVTEAERPATKKQSPKPKAVPDLLDRARQRWASGENDLALTDAGAAIKANPKDARAYVVRFCLLNQRQRWDEALADATKAKQLDPQCFEAGWSVDELKRIRNAASLGEDYYHRVAKLEREKNERFAARFGLMSEEERDRMFRISRTFKAGDLSTLNAIDLRMIRANWDFLGTDEFKQRLAKFADGMGADEHVKNLGLADDKALSVRVEFALQTSENRVKALAVSRKYKADGPGSLFPEMSAFVRQQPHLFGQ